jgi:hypothetical protein
MKKVAAGLASLGRGPDTMLVHMSPKEVAGLQKLAMAHGGSLTLNPHTGLPEAGFLQNILPAIAAAAAVYFTGGAALAAAPGAAAAGAVTGAAGTAGLMGLTAAQTGALAGATTGALTNKENRLQGALLGGLGGYGAGGGMGAAMNSGMITPGAEVASAGMADVGLSGGNASQIEALNAAESAARTSGITNAMSANPNLASVPTLAQPATTAVDPYAIDGAIGARSPGMETYSKPTFMDALGQQFPSTGSQAAAGLGALGTVGAFDQPELDFLAPQQQPSNYRAQTMNRRPYDPERNLFTDYGQVQPVYAAEGGEMRSVPELEDGGFVLTKRAVDGMGKGSNQRGQRAAAAGLGSIPIKGPGTGTSDSIPTTIEGKRPALLSNGEAYVPKDQVKRRGGAKKFYALMKQAEREAARRA